MDKIRNIFRFIAAVFAVLSLTKIISYDIAMPAMCVSMGIFCLSNGVLEVKKGKRISAVVDFLLSALFFYCFVASLRNAF